MGQDASECVHGVGGRWLVAKRGADGRYFAPCRPHVGGSYFGTLEYVSQPVSSVYSYKRRSDAVRAARKLYGLDDGRA